MILRSAFLMQLSAELDAPQILDDTPLGPRRIMCMKGGSFAGPALKGEMLPVGVAMKPSRVVAL